MVQPTSNQNKAMTQRETTNFGNEGEWFLLLYS